jgi:hypothetical protein
MAGGAKQKKRNKGLAKGQLRVIFFKTVWARKIYAEHRIQKSYFGETLKKQAQSC